MIIDCLGNFAITIQTSLLADNHERMGKLWVLKFYGLKANGLLSRWN